MARHNICLLHGHDAALLLSGAILKHSEHGHIDAERAQLLASGADLRPWLDPDYYRTGQISERAGTSSDGRSIATARWAMLPDGTISRKHLEVLSARSWQAIGGAMQYALLGSTRAARKHGRTHLRGPRAEKRGPVRELFCPIPALTSSLQANVG